MNNVLLITYLFPPSGGVGVPRAMAYARYLPAHGCRVSVLTPRYPATAYYDPELEELIPSRVRVYRVFNPEPPYRLKSFLWRVLAPRCSTIDGQNEPLIRRLRMRLGVGSR